MLLKLHMRKYSKSQVAQSYHCQMKMYLQGVFITKEVLYLTHDHHACAQAQSLLDSSLVAVATGGPSHSLTTRTR